MAQCFCQKCNKTMEESQFYTYKDGPKTDMCKKCLPMHIDTYDESNFVWLLEKMDVPYIPEEWNVLRDKAYMKDPTKMNGMSVFGKYLSKMRLKKWKEYGWKDSEALQQENKRKAAAAAEEQALREGDIQQQFDNGEISAAQYATLMSGSTVAQENPYGINGLAPDPLTGNAAAPIFYDETKLYDLASELTEEDKKYLALKWGCQYKPTEWIKLEEKYNEMSTSFDIQDSDTIGTLILICKTYLKMNQAIDQGDLEAFQKLSRVYDSLRKSAKFTAAQNKETKGDYFDSIGEMVALCEKEEGFIPRYATDIPKDKVDLTLRDMNNYLKKLVTQDLGFGQQIEDSLKKIQLQKELNEAEREAELKGESFELQDEDFKEFYETAQEQKALDEESDGDEYGAK